MADYNALKVPELKKLLGSRDLVQSGNKSDLIARLVEDDAKKGGDAAPTEDVIDWDDEADGSKAATKPEATPAAAKPAAKTDAAPVAKAADSSAPKAAAEKSAPEPASTEAAPSETTPAAPAAEAPKSDFALGLSASNADVEAKKREARAKRFGISASAAPPPASTTTDETTTAATAAATKTEDTADAKKAARAKRFGLDETITTDETVVLKGLDSALPERRAKRGRGKDDEGAENGASARKKGTPDRRLGGKEAGAGGRGGRREGKGRGGGGDGGGEKKAAPVVKKNVLDDPSEKAKAEARAKRFGGS